jgi:hypothetical protein
MDKRTEEVLDFLIEKTPRTFMAIFSKHLLQMVARWKTDIL